ncbi:MAG: flagellar biosynthetic protein FliO [Oligoflexales bacterium]|nr:flagellar biosynthetic protein FliO [Oligoflexales bacterium]
MGKSIFNKKNLINLNLIFVLLVTAIAAFANIGQTVLKNVKIENSGNLTFITMELSNKPTWSESKIENHGGFLQVELKDVTIAAPGKFYDSDSKIFSKVAAFQTDENNAAVRIFLNKESTNISEAAHIELLENRLIVSVDNTLMNSDEKLAKKSDATKKNDPASLLKQESTKEASPQGMFTEEFLGRSAIASAFLLILIIAMVFIKSKIKTKKIEQTPATQLSLKMISSLNLSPKQRLALIQVGTEQILIAISSERVDVIKTVGNSPQAKFTDFLGSGSTASNAAPTRNTLPIQSKTLQLSNESKINGNFRSELQSEGQKKLNEAAPLEKGRRINVAIDDNGIHSKTEISEPSKSETIEDITNLIRNKLKKIPR